MSSDFPRGGRSPATAKAEIKNTFSLGKNPPKKKPRSKVKKGVENEDDFIPTTVQFLSYSTIVEGMIILGRVQLSSDYFLTISLPNGVIGYIQATDISEKYTELLRDIVDDKISDDFLPLRNLYKPGDYLVCYVKEKSIDDGKVTINLTSEPLWINENLDHTKLQSGSKIICSINSVEDHGYVVDTGIKNLRGFLSKKDVDKNVVYYTGKQVYCNVKSYDTKDNITTIKLSSKVNNSKSPIHYDNQSLDALIPGSRIQLVIEKVLHNGLHVSFNNNYTGFIHQTHLCNPLDSYNEGTSVVGTLLYVTKTIKFAYFSLLSFDNDENGEMLRIGSVIDNAKVLCKDKSGIILKLSNKHRGLIKSSLLKNIADINSQFPLDSTHKCKILAYNTFDKLYHCSTNLNVLNDSFVTSIKPGDVVTVEVNDIDREKNVIMVHCKIIKGKLTSFYNKPDLLENISIGDKVEAIALHTNELGNRWFFSIDKTLIRNKLPILNSYEDAKLNDKHAGIVYKKRPGLSILFFNNVRGWIPESAFSGKKGGIYDYSVGDVVTVQIDDLDVSKEKILLSIPDSAEVNDAKTVEDEVDELDVDFELKIGNTIRGVVDHSSSEGVHLKIKCNEKYITGFIPAGHMAPSLEIGSYLSNKYQPGDHLSALVFSLTPTFLLSRTFVPDERYTNFKKLKVNDCIPCSVESIEDNKLKLILPIENCNKLGKVLFADTKKLYKHQLVFGKITRINKKNQEIFLTTMLKDVNEENNSTFITPVNYLSMYFDKYSELSMLDCFETNPISKIKLGDKVCGSIAKILDYGMVINLENGISAIVNPMHYITRYEIGSKVTATVLWIDYINNFVEVSLHSRYNSMIASQQNDLPDTMKNTPLKGVVLSISKWFILAVLKSKGTLVALPVRSHVNDTDPVIDRKNIGCKINCKLVLTKSESGILPICTLQIHDDLDRTGEKRGKTEDDSTVKTKKRKLNEKDTNVNDNDTTVEVKDDEIDVEDEYLKQQNGDDHDGVELCKKPKIKKKIPKSKKVSSEFSISDVGFVWNPVEIEKIKEESSSESENEEDDDKKSKKRKLNRAERKELEKEKERAIREKEEALASNETPNSADQFDRLVLGNPDSSVIWIQYMVYHLQATEIDKARSVARRALKTINFREEQERFNVWQALLNLESRFGTPDTLNKVFYEAIQSNDAVKVYLHMLTVHFEAGRHAEVEKTISVITGKFKQEPQAWIQCGSILLQMGFKEKSRAIMQRAIQSLLPAHHISLMIKFAQLENTYGDKERCQTLFESILTSYPKRVDVWLVYIDSLIKSKDIELARQVLEKAVEQNLRAKKMKSLFQKFVTFEQKYGNEERVEYARQLAVKYVESQCKDT